MDRFLCIEAFVRVAETNSFAEAARQLGVTRSVVSSRIQQLENYINTPLFHRNTRNVRLSEVAEMFYQECSDVVGHVNALTDQMRELRATPTGKLRIQMLPGFALDHFGTLLAQFSRNYPDIQIDIVVNDQLVDPIEGGVDVSFQIFPPHAESLIQRKLFIVRRLFCAAPSYLQEYGTPVLPHDLLQHRTALYSAYPSRNRWTLSHDNGVVEIELHNKITSNSVHLLRDYALAGAGIVCLPTLVASHSLQNGTLVPLLTDYTLEPLDFCAVYPITQRQSTKVKALLSFINEHLRGEPAWDIPLIARGWVR